MKTIALSLAQIGNSRGVRLPADLIRKHGFEDGLVLEDRGHEIALKPKGGSKKLSWADTARAMAASAEDWSDWDCTLADGLADVPWAGTIPKNMFPKKKSKVARKK